MGTKGLNESGFAHARRTGEAQSDGGSGGRVGAECVQLVEELINQAAVFGQLGLH